MATIELSAEAEQDLATAAAWLDEQEPGLGLTLIEAFGRAIEGLELFPRRGQRTKRGYRRVLVRPFRYGVFYRYDPDEELVAIVSVVDLRRHPDVWKGRR